MAIAHVASLALPFAGAHTRRVTFAELVREHQDEVFGLALRMLGDRDAAMDVTSSVFLKAFRAFDRYDPARPARHWLIRIAVNECISAGRSRSRERAHRAGADDALGVPDRAPAPDEEAVAREERSRVRSAVADLAEPYRTVTVLRYFSGLAVDEIARITGRPSSTVGVQLLRARAQLRRALGGEA
jgi:RNA polymerase sigma-70 factor (ECF subfamily)